jgi:hypothetical protein
MPHLTRLRPIGYTVSMATNCENDDFTQRLVEIGREDLLARISSGDIKLFEAMIIAGFCEANPIERVAVLTNRWNRLSETEKRKFTSDNLAEILPIISGLQTEKGQENLGNAKDQTEPGTAFNFR